LENRIRDVSLEAYGDGSNQSEHKLKGCINMAIVAEGLTVCWISHPLQSVHTQLGVLATVPGD